MDGMPQFDLEAAQREKQEAEEYNRKMALMGAIGDNLSSRQSVGNFMLGKMNPTSDAGAKLASATRREVSDPQERYSKLLTNYRGLKEAEKAKMEGDSAQENSQKGGPKYLAMRDSIMKAYPGLSLPDNLSVNDLNEQLPHLTKPILANLEIDKMKEMERFKSGLQRGELAYKADLDSKNPAKQFDRLPKESQSEIAKIADKNGNMIAIKNEIDSALKQLDDSNISDDQKLIVGRQLIKTLNSTQGADAVGAEEAKRLGSLLEFKVLPRIGEPGNLFGRDLGEFRNQVALTSGRIGNTYKSNRGSIERLKAGQDPDQYVAQVKDASTRGADFINEAKAAESTPTEQDMKALSWAKQNLGNPKAEAILTNLRARKVIK